MDPFDIMKASQISCCLEVSSFKPGNVHRCRDYKDIKYHHFITSGIGFGDIVYKAAYYNKDNKNKHHNVGKYIKLSVIQSKKWAPTNTNLGIIMLHIPLSIGASKLEEFSVPNLKNNLINIAKSTTVEDALNVYDAIKIAMPNIGSPKNGPDANKEDSKKEIIENNLTLYDIFKISSSWDSISKEWTSGFNISFKGYEYLKEFYDEKKDINLAITKTYLTILSNHPDTLIGRKAGLNKAVEISNRAKEIVENGFKEEGIKNFDEYLSKDGNKLNPGTTADLTASSLMIFLLDRIYNNNTIFY